MSEHADDPVFTLAIEHEGMKCRFWLGGELSTGGIVFIMLLHEEITREIIGAAMEVHTALGAGFLEAAYEEALAHELKLRNLSFERQVHVPIRYKGIIVDTHRLDLIVDGKVIVELKAIADLAEVHKAVAISYLSATKLTVALLLNFGQPKLQVQRVVRQRQA